MEAQEYPIAHYQLMMTLALWMSKLPAQILHSKYHYDSFGCWSSTFRYQGRVFRIQYDGKDKMLYLEKADSRKPPYKWSGPVFLRNTTDKDFPFEELKVALGANKG